MTGLRPVLAALLLIAFLSGCAGGNRIPPPATTTATSHFGVPEAARPRSAAAVYPSPCENLLTSSELSMLDILGAGRPRTYFGVNECAWTTRNDDRLRVGVDVSRNLLADSYRAARPEVFLPVEIEGVPAVRQRLSFATNACNVTVGLSASQSLEADWTGHRSPSAEEDPCAKAEEAIALVVRKLPPQR